MTGDAHGSQNEKVQWRINRIDYILEGSVDGIERAKEELITKLTDLYPAKIVDWRNKLLASVSFVATFLATLAGFTEFEYWRIIFLEIILFDLVLGIAVFIVFTHIRNTIGRQIRQIEIRFLDKINNYNQLKIIHGKHSSRPECLADEHIRLILDYITLVNFDFIELRTEIDELSKFRFTRGIQSDLINWVRDYDSKLSEYQRLFPQKEAEHKILLHNHKVAQEDLTKKQQSDCKYEVFLDLYKDLSTKIILKRPTSNKPPANQIPDNKMTAFWLIILTLIVCSAVPALMIWLTSVPDQPAKVILALF